MNARALIYELLDFVDDVVDELGSRPFIEYAARILQEGTGADKQLAVFEQNNDLLTVTDFIKDQFLKEI